MQSWVPKYSDIYIYIYSIKLLLFKMECRMSGLLHVRAREGDVEGVVQVLDSGRVHVDCKDQV